MAVQVELSVAAELRIRAQPSELAPARRYAAAAASAFGLDAEDGYDFVYAVNEAVTNAIRHGAPDEHGQILLGVRVEDARLVFTVRDFGVFAMPAWPPKAEPESGRGFALMERLVDDVQVRVDHHGTTVALTKARM